MRMVLLYHFLLPPDLSAVASPFYILPPSPEVENIVTIKDEGEDEVLLEKGNKRNLLQPFVFFFSWFSEPTPMFSLF